MPLFQTDVQIDQQLVSQILKDNWGINLGKLIQSSQNYTFEGFRSGNQEIKQERFAIRFSPDPLNNQSQKIKDQVCFVNYLTSHKLNHLCPFVPKTLKQTQDEFVYIGDRFSLVVIQWANGQKLQFPDFQWMKNQKVVFAWGKLFAQLHLLSKNFETQHKAVAQRIQSWRKIHNGLLDDVKLDQADEKDVESHQHYGVIHGDFNCSNFFYDRANETINVFDTDQVQRGFYLWDLSRAIFTSYMLQQAGMPNNGTPVPLANRKQFQTWIVQGYQSVTGKGSVDLERLERMLLLNKHFYITFCKKAVEQGNAPQDMRPFVEYIAKYLEKK